MTRSEANPYVISLAGESEVVFPRLIRWLMHSEMFQGITWELLDFDSSTTDDTLETGVQLKTDELPRLVSGQLIDLLMITNVDNVGRFKVNIQESGNVELLGHGTPPTEFEVGTRYKFMELDEYQRK